MKIGNLADKLRQAIESLEIGGGLENVFEGLETGHCTIEVMFNGEYVRFSKSEPIVSPTPSIILEEPQIPQSSQVEPKKRRRKHENTKS